MNKKRFIPTFKNCLLTILSAILIITFNFAYYNKPNINTYVVKENKKSQIISTIPNVFTETSESTKFYQTTINLKNLTIKENESYQIKDFIENINNLPQEITYNYTIPEMNSYKLPGTYKIQITFKDAKQNTLEKETNLIIEQIKITQNPVAKSQSKEEPKQDNLSDLEKRIKNDSKKIGDSGRLYFNNLFSIALYQPTTSEEAQRYVDNKDSGSIIKYDNISYIADHANQGFDIIKKQKAGNYIYLKRIDNNGNIIIDKYIVKIKTNGYNTKYELLTQNGLDVRNTDYPLALYTCNSPDGYHVTILLLAKA